MRIVIIGAGGRLGGALLQAYRKQFEVTGFSHAEIDLRDLSEVEQLLAPLNFDLMINCAALTNVDLCEEQPDAAFLINTDAPELMARICEGKEARLIHFSTDYVFDGKKRQPYVEEDETASLGIYAESKRDGERAVLAEGGQHLVVRVSWVFGPERPSFVDNVIQRAREFEQVEAVGDKFSTPTYTRDVAELLPRLFTRDVNGLLHLANTGICSWREYAQHALDCCWDKGLPLKTREVGELKLADMKNFVAERPVYTVLDTQKFAQATGITPRPWKEAVAEYVRDFVS